MVTIGKCLFCHTRQTSCAFSHIFTRHFHVHAARMTSHFIVHVEKGSQFIANLFKAAGFDARFSLVGVAMDRIGNPQDGLAFTLHSTNQSRQVFAQLFGTHAHNNGQAAGDVLGVHGINDFNQFLGGALVRNLDAQWVANTTNKLQVCTVQLSCSFSHPQHVSGAIVPAIRCRVLSCQGLFVRQQQTFVCNIKVSLGKGGCTSVDTNGFHETKRFVNLVGKLAVATSFGGVFDKVQVPGVQTTNVGVSSRRKGTKNVECLCRLVVGANHIVGVVSPGIFGKLFRVDNISPVRWESHVSANFIGFGARFRKLSRHASHLDDRHGTAKGQDQGHLQNDAKGITHVVDIEFLERFGTISTHEQKTLSGTSPGQLFVQGSDFSGKD
mmetsp:Transcript_12399/g.27329  ORF Transcript_12399/g.27329 Transcript_12399/m.27329 type:complete len:382 (-) Transcript_12399:527-1672(-)